MNQKTLLEAVRFNEEGLVPVIAQDLHAKKVRMLAYMNEEALRKTLETGKVHYYSRSRKKLWLKGETSGHFQKVKQISIDCDGDTLLLQIEQVGGISCHTGHATCFYTNYTLETDKLEEVGVSSLKGTSTFEHLYEIVKERKLNPKEGSYTNYLLEQGENKILKKIGEEVTELIVAAKDNENDALASEIADFLYHLNVLMVEKNLTWDEVDCILSKRA